MKTSSLTLKSSLRESTVSGLTYNENQQFKQRAVFQWWFAISTVSVLGLMSPELGSSLLSLSLFALVSLKPLDVLNRVPLIVIAT